MLRNYIKIAFRNIANNAVFTAINIFGLTVGVSACLVIFLIVNFELSFDTFHPDGDRIYRVYTEFRGVFNGFNRGVSDPVPGFAKENFSGIESSTHFHTYSATVTVPRDSQEPERFDRQSDLAIAGADYFEVFNTYEWLAGDPSTSLDRPFQVVISASKAGKYFGVDKNYHQLLGRELIYNDSLVVRVAGVINDFRKNSDLIFTDFISFPTVEKSWLKDNYSFDQWGNTNSNSQFFIKLEPQITLRALEPQLTILHEKVVEQNPDSDYSGWFRLQPLSDLHFNKELGIFDHGRSPAHLPTLNSLVVIVIMLLLIASINFINLSTAQATRRAKEIGVRKVMGGSRKMLVLQFLSESTLLSLVAVLLALPLCEMALLFFSEFIPEGVKLDLMNLNTLVFLFAMVLIVGIISGLYPAMVISGYQPVKALKDRVYSGSGNSLSIWLRKGLTVFQFSFSQVLITLALVITLQIGFILERDLGFEKDAIVYFNTPWWDSRDKRDVLVNELNQYSEFMSLSVHQSPPATRGFHTTTITYKADDGELKNNVHRKTGDTDYLSFYGLPLVTGRNFIASDSAREIIINETYARQLGFEQPVDILGEPLFVGDDKPHHVVGVVKDFHFQSMHHAIQPMAIFYGRGTCIGLKFPTSDKQSANIKQGLDNLTTAWKKVYPDQPLKYYFMDEAVQLFYESEQRTAKLVNTATAVAIIISCLGLFGLVSFSTVQRTKEIGVRKVLGATVGNIVVLISKDFLKLVLIAFLLSAPVAYWLSEKWMNDFAYRIELDLWIFLITGLVSVAIAFGTLGYQALKAAMSDPVNSLRYE